MPLRGAAALLLVTGCASCLGNGSLPLCLLLLLVARQRALFDGGAKWKGPHWLDAAPASSAFGSTAAVGSRCAFG